ncbi:MAG: electron transfer flavoprotein subunit alpha/FixB family protein [Armatimonadota bacterium]|nr:electron transfer flavoprotein subunit alpha/FixB family protein [Armatimonadota bacterium]MDR7463658.1 electron transfer flavoprotein subunit alpha/FixB family protein [Armatimonadota bacterium]MDR7468669.1 electron transfer flavoprotein subunit alpha/FixB family protein [Armatimonadota bacterium]MDR7473792.1 electron transfer flavoprotein subunit alpha/FixB family protein [Armatimonadota bacterium]MDR7538175.1 electron transfer flavoprotein subunit alpha/FixB family protein [Armatimonadota
MAGDIWVLVEQWRGQVTDVTYEVLALGRELATATGGSLQAVLLGPGVAEVPPSLGAADGVLVAENTALGEPEPDLYALVLAQVIPRRQPEALLIPQTNALMGCGPLLAARLGLSCINSCRDVHLDQGRLLARCLLYGGKVEAAVVPERTPVVLGILPGARPREQGRIDRTPPCAAVSVDLPATPPVQFRGYTEPPPGDVDITREDVLVAVGRGIQRQENVALAEELAAALGGAVCGSRPVVDQGWLPASRQVGTSGMIVEPQMYLALGISGAPEHVEGMKRARLIIAINTDPRAPIFGVAHYGVTADLFDIVPLLIDRIRAARQKAAS